MKTIKVSEKVYRKLIEKKALMMQETKEQKSFSEVLEALLCTQTKK